MTIARPKEHAGFSAVEVLIAVAIGAIVIAAIASQAVHLGRQSRAFTRKLRSLELSRDITRAFDAQKACDCNVTGLDVTAASGAGSYEARLPQTRAVTAGCAAGAPTLAQAGQVLPGPSYQLSVAKISVKDMQPINGAYGVATQFTGALTVEFDPESMALGIPPVSVKRLFYVKNNQIVRCGPSQHRFFQVWGDTSTTNDLNGTAVATVACPDDAEVVGGGLQTLGAALPIGCEIGLYALETLSSYPDVTANTWNVLARCRTVLPVAMCRRKRADD